eukprot:m.509187 g.509187  ORF g.509187 m.509187 type:complete len:321 (+) comp57395_c0_seq1:7-969(+)
MSATTHARQPTQTSTASAGEYKHTLRNFRDVAEVQTVPAMKPGVLFRSATPGWATRDDCRHLLETLRVRTVIDLREPAERKTDPGPGIFHKHFVEDVELPALLGEEPLLPGNNPLTEESGPVPDKVRLVHLPYLRGKRLTLHYMKLMPWVQRLLLAFFLVLGLVFPACKRKAKEIGIREFNRLGMISLYEFIVVSAAAEIVNVLRILSQPRNHGVLVNCSHGKDRTGVTVAVVLTLMGASREAILADYARSSEFGLSAEGQGDIASRGQGVNSAFGDAPAELMQQTLEFIERKYGSVQAYLVRSGFSEHNQQALIRALSA